MLRQETTETQVSVVILLFDKFTFCRFDELKVDKKFGLANINIISK